MKVLKCPVCERVVTTVRRNKTCGRRCGQQLVKRERGADFHRVTGQRAGRATAKTTRRKSLELWKNRWPGVSDETARAIHTQGYNSGHATGQRTGFKQGYDAAISGLRLEKTA